MNERPFSRRTFLAGSAAALGGCAGSPGSESTRQPDREGAETDSMPTEWTNWSGRVTCTPRKLAAPSSEEELRRMVRRARTDGHQTMIRVAASGHSFVPLCASSGTLISLDNLQGIESTDRDALSATVRAGTKIHQLGQPLREAGMAMENMGDIDRQGIAGAISTGTHGTGRGIGNLSTQVTGLRLIVASGEVVECSADREPQILKAAQVSLGSLGILTHVTLRLLPAYRLHEKVWEAPIDECLADLEQLIDRNRHFEFFWWPRRDRCSMKTLNPTEGPPDELPDREGERIGHSDQIFPSVRDTKFNEIEFAVSEDRGPDCFQEIRELMLQKHTEIEWPIEYRTLGADSLYLSPAFGRDTVTISAHQASDLPCEAFFADVEAIFRKHGGRPHWGKIHTHTAAELGELYPMWERFHEIRRELDPDGLFMNDHLRGVFL